MPAPVQVSWAKAMPWDRRAMRLEEAGIAATRDALAARPLWSTKDARRDGGALPAPCALHFLSLLLSLGLLLLLLLSLFLVLFSLL